jgi:hypothetical protein
MKGKLIDPDKIIYLEKKLLQIHPMIRKDLQKFIQYLETTVLDIEKVLT